MVPIRVDRWVMEVQTSLQRMTNNHMAKITPTVKVPLQQASTNKTCKLYAIALRFESTLIYTNFKMEHQIHDLRRVVAQHLVAMTGFDSVEFHCCGSHHSSASNNQTTHNIFTKIYMKVLERLSHDAEMGIFGMDSVPRAITCHTR
jgi:hypothetical protein